jgi:hypothetical protein
MLLDYKKKRSIYELHHRERLAAIDKGMEVPPLPPELFNGGSKPRFRTSGYYLLRGLIWSAVGGGILLSLRSVAGEEESWLGLIPLLVGVAYLLYYAVEGRRLPREAEAVKKEMNP